MRTILNVMMAFAAAASVAACQSRAGGREEPEIPANVTISSVVEVKTITAQHKPFEYLIQSNGKVRPLKEQSWVAEQDRVLGKFNGQNGTFYRKGQVIAEFATEIISLKLQKAKLAQYNAEKEYQSALLGYENLLKDKSTDEVEAIKKKLRISSGLAYAEQDIREIEFELERSVIRAPFDGVLADVKVRQDMRLKATDEMFKLYDPSELILETNLLEADVYLLKQGVQADVSPVADGLNKCKASLLRINPYVNENGMVQVTLKIHAAPGRVVLFPGMNCAAVMKIPLAPCIVVPKEAVVMHDGKAVVFTTEQGLAKWHYVTTGRENGKEIEIKEGLEPNVQVIASNNLQLAHDAPVKEIKQ